MNIGIAFEMVLQQNCLGIAASACSQYHILGRGLVGLQQEREKEQKTEPSMCKFIGFFLYQMLAVRTALMWR